MRVALSCCGALWVLVALLPAGPLSGITAKIVPEQVRAGDLFELRVAMSRADYASFELQVPPHERLHRVAVESVPVSFEDGRYRQSEIWFLQADSSGEIVIDGATVSLESGSGPATVELPALRVEVVAYGQQDESAEPVGFPSVSPPETKESVSGWWWIAPGLLVVLGFVGWMAKGKRATGSADVEEDVALDAVLADLDSGQIASPALERMMLEQGGGWSAELRGAVGAALYAGRGEAGRLAAMLRKEVAR